MKKLTTLLVTLIFISATDAQITFQKTYGTSSNEGGISCQQTSDGGYIVAGDGDAWGKVSLVKTDKEGTLSWAKIFLFDGTTTYSEVRHVLQVSDGGYLINGFREQNFNNDLFVIRTDSAGNVAWAKTFGTSGDDYSYWADETDDAGFVIAGSTSGLVCLVLKLDADGDLLWKKNYNDASEAYCVQQTPDGGYLITSSINYDACVIKTDDSGNVLWAKAYGNSYTNYGWAGQQVSDGGYIISGETRDAFDSGDMYLIRTDSQGDMLWSKSYGGTGWEFSTSVQQTSDGGFMVSGTWDYTGNGEIYLVKTDTEGNLTWSKTYGGLNNEFSWGSGSQTSDRGFIITSFTDLGNGSIDVYLVKTDSMGNSGCYETIPSTIVEDPATQEYALVISTSETGSISTTTLTVENMGEEATLCLATGQNEVAIKNDSVSISPNPTQTEFHISSPKNSFQYILITDLSGKIVKNFFYRLLKTKSRFQLLT